MPEERLGIFPVRESWQILWRGTQTFLVKQSCQEEHQEPLVLLYNLMSIIDTVASQTQHVSKQAPAFPTTHTQAVGVSLQSTVSNLYYIWIP